MNTDAHDEQQRAWTVSSDAAEPTRSGAPDVGAPDVAISGAALPDVALPAVGSPQLSGSGSSISGSVDAELDALAQLSLAQHADVFDRVHQGLRDALAGIDDA